MDSALKRENLPLSLSYMVVNNICQLVEKRKPTNFDGTARTRRLTEQAVIR